ncbi:hypothetical protein [Methylomusa anaerophila]|uniref:Uncharacterized protein n=1 Tax=Methylomusa anaerophila TaxID=1930071 RepID=A0A348AR08_9FIRM|nr:hypothetical protein [Methylomusa anaerophila]BBB93506.1 hypothetical protein MAMMFC1_04223 [Methylomusa anaerophila]
MPSAYWYYGLVVISLVLLAASLVYKRDWKLLVLQLNVAALIHPFEIVVLILLNAYRYSPGILANPILDNYIGSYISNSFIVPASAIAINAFSLSWGYALGIAAIFTGIDWYFTTLGIYQHFWWKSVYTGIGLSILYAISRWIWAGLQEKRPHLIFRLAVIYLTYSPLHNLLVFLVNKGGQLFIFQMPWSAGDPQKYHQGFFFLYLLITSIIITLCVGLKLRLRYRLLGIAVLALAYWTLEQYHIFLPVVADISAWQLVLVPIIVVPVVVCLFRVAALDYLFPR